MAGQQENQGSSLGRSGRSWAAYRDLGVLAGLLIAALSAWVFIELAEEVVEGDTHAADAWVVHALRRPDQSGLPRGPDWLVEAGRDITALGGTAVLVLVTAVAVGFLLLQRQFTLAALVAAAVLGGWLVCHGMKLAFARQRPPLQGPLVWVTTPSFPSGHAKLSAVVYLSLGALLARTQARRRIKLYIMGVAVLLTFLVGVSRVYLGVHYPTDVLAGWAAGLAWMLPWWIAARVLHAGQASDRGPPGPRARTPSMA